MRKLVITISIILIFNFSFCLTSEASNGDIKILVDGSYLKSDVRPVNVNGRLLIPLRSVMQSLGLRVTWIDKDRKIIVKDDNIRVELFIDKNIARVNGKTVAVQIAPMLAKDATMIPLRFISEVFNQKINYDSQTNTVTINRVTATEPKTEPPLFVAHAGGGISGVTYTNCLEAMENSINRGIQVIEVDFSFTSDHKIVLLHTWDGFIEKFFNRLRGMYSYDEFTNFQMAYGWHQMTLTDLIAFMKQHPEVMIITDTKDDNTKLLTEISTEGKDVIDRFIPQIYTREEYETVKKLGYSKIVFTLYRTSLPNQDVVDFAKNNDLYAIAMPEARATMGLPQSLSNIGVFTYCHTINDVETAKQYIKLGIHGFYTDSLVEDSFFK